MPAHRPDTTSRRVDCDEFGKPAIAMNDAYQQDGMTVSRVFPLRGQSERRSTCTHAINKHIHAARRRVEEKKMKYSHHNAWTVHKSRVYLYACKTTHFNFFVFGTRTACRYVYMHKNTPRKGSIRSLSQALITTTFRKGVE